METIIAGRVLTLIEGDITEVPADVIVNAANSRLAGGGGVDGAIHRAGGPSIMRELDPIRARIGSCKAGDAVITHAGNLPARWVVHAVGPVYRGGTHGEPEVLASCYRTAVRLAEEHGAKTIAFPSISTGVYGYPMEEAATIALETVAEALRRPDCPLEKAAFVLFGEEAYRAHADAARRLF